MLIQVEPGKPGAEVSKEKLPICQKNKLADRNVSALRPCFACVTVSIIVRNISIPACVLATLSMITAWQQDARNLPYIRGHRFFTNRNVSKCHELLLEQS